MPEIFKRTPEMPQPAYALEGLSEEVLDAGKNVFIQIRQKLGFEAKQQ